MVDITRYIPRLYTALFIGLGEVYSSSYSCNEEYQEKTGARISRSMHPLLDLKYNFTDIRSIHMCICINIKICMYVAFRYDPSLHCTREYQRVMAGGVCGSYCRDGDAGNSRLEPFNFMSLSAPSLHVNELCDTNVYVSTSSFL